MNNFIYENKTKVIFGKGCAKEYLTCLLKNMETMLCLLTAEALSKKTVSTMR